MRPLQIALLCMASVFAGCVTQPLVCQADISSLELSPATRYNVGADIELISISSTGRVKVRFGEKTWRRDAGIYTAKAGEPFRSQNGRTPPGEYTLRSVDVESGKVVIESTMYSIGRS
jgi:hypothetical protein